MRPRTQFLICTTPRSGSTLLCSLLGSTGLAGMRRGQVVGHEYALELVGRRDQRTDFGPLDRDSLRRFFQDAFDRSRTPNGVAGFKLMWEQVRRLALRLGYPANSEGFGFHDFATLFPETTRFIWLTRRERVRQAVSLVKAVQSQCWNSAEQERFTSFYVFDYLALKRTVKMLEHHDAMWREFFEHNAIKPLEVVYEDVIRDRWEQVQRIAGFVEIPGAVASEIGEVHYRKQSVSLNDLWVERFERICSLGPVLRSLYTAWSLPRWIGLRVLSRFRAARRVRRLPSGERLEPR
jgi:LPS sulfotransferase NodH